MPIVITGQRFPYYKVILDDNPVGYWRLGESIGTSTAFDSSGNGHDGSYVGPPILETNGLIRGNNTAADFDGSNDYVVVTERPALDITGEITLECWVKTNTLPSTTSDGIMGKYLYNAPPGPDRGYTLTHNVDGTTSISVSSDNSTGLSVASITNITDGNSHHIVGVFVPSIRLDIYIDGELDNSETSGVVSSIQNTSTDFWIGMYGENGSLPRFNGIIDEVAIYNKALTPTQIQQHYNAGT